VRVGPFTDGYLPEPSDVTTPVRWLKEELEQLGHVATLYAPHGTAGRRTMPLASSASAHGLLLSTRPYASPFPTTAERRGRSGISTSCTAISLSRWGSSHWRRERATASRASTPTTRTCRVPAPPAASPATSKEDGRRRLRGFLQSPHHRDSAVDPDQRGAPPPRRPICALLFGVSLLLFEREPA
jgi:hypothetical protein